MSDVIGSKSGSHVALPDVWRLTVEGAESERDLVVAVRDYLATWEPSEIAALPEAARPGRVTSGEDISEMAYKLSQVHLEFEGAPDEHRTAVERLMGFFLHAAQHYSRLAAVHREPHTGPDG